MQNGAANMHMVLADCRPRHRSLDREVHDVDDENKVEQRIGDVSIGLIARFRVLV
jgi:hypothetical protein